MTDRLAEGYVPNFDIDAAVGRQGELVVFSVIDALAHGGSVEVKTDEKASKTQRIYIEDECKTLRGWTPSGIASTSAELWAVVLGGEVVVAAPTSRFRYAHDWALRHRLEMECKRGSHPTKGSVVPLPKLLSLLMEAS